MQIGEISERSGVSVRMLRYYEAEGLLTPHRRDSGYRDYSDADLEEACRIRQLADAGLTIDAMRDLLPCIISPEPRFDPCENLRARLSGELEKLDRKLEDIGRSRDLIAGYIDSLGPTS
ncbi:MAG: MerR family transcriptional regulator [Stappia sp.]|uniref:MerR family transcriptional regulator n=1 Tax=Stappia sp. TaxID=1870903 RepID=UPI000C5CC8B4|nr:MerR family transcriptional regulator [Stappia sp.]MAA99927.1 MerR family transcriptional regulator [Stappia sp.]MBM20945.1 MerR family transcriptional regulator [Stappia sp.]|tara:strand:+ start:172 stop:528 length:357 start_codon:yes stop_codon:yes gene_type:complete